MENRDKISRISDIPRDDLGLITGATPVAEVRLSISEVLSIVVLLPISSLVSTFVSGESGWPRAGTPLFESR
jgi:hypothetical protein